MTGKLAEPVHEPLSLTSGDLISGNLTGRVFRRIHSHIRLNITLISTARPFQMGNWGIAVTRELQNISEIRGPDLNGTNLH